MDNAEFITAAIPDSLRLAEHPDAKLVCEGITSALVAYRDSGGVRDKTIARDIHAALSRFVAGVFTPHINEEDEAWNSMKARAESAYSTLALTNVNAMPGVINFRWDVGAEQGTGVAYKHGSEYAVTLLRDNGEQGPSYSTKHAAVEDKTLEYALKQVFSAVAMGHKMNLRLDTAPVTSAFVEPA